jgi:UDP-glucuronate 4-epimerase
MKLLITGFAGFIGFHLTKKLIQAGHIVWGIDNFNDYYENSLKYDRINQLGISASALIGGQLIQSDKFPTLHCLRADITDINQIKFLFDTAKI